MSALEEIQGFIHTIRARHSETGSVTVQTAARWAEEIRELRQEVDDSGRIAVELAAENAVLEDTLEELRNAVKHLQIANIQLYQQLMISEIGEDPLREA